MLVLDANILVRAVLGKRTRSLLHAYAGRVEFVTPSVCFDDARLHLPRILERRNLDQAPFMSYLASLDNYIRAVDSEAYCEFEAVARRRLAGRDEDDWPILAVALALQCPIWTEDTDFFGCGVSIWTTDRVEIYLAGTSPEAGE